MTEIAARREKRIVLNGRYRSRMILVLGICLGLGVWGGKASGGSASANETPKEKIARARRLFLQGKRSFKKKAYRRALRYFEQAFQVWHNRVFHFNIAVVHARLGNQKKAVAHVFAYLKGASASERRLPAELEKLFHSYGIIQVSTPHENAQHWVDGRRVKTGREMKQVVAAGVHNVEIRRHGRCVARRAISVVGGQVVNWTVSAESGPAGGELNRVVRAGGRNGDRSPTPQTIRTVHWGYFAALSGVAAAGLGAALGLYFKTKRVNDRYLADTTQKNLRSEGLRYQHATNTLFGVAAGAAVAAAVVAVFTRWRSPHTEASVAVGATPLPGGGIVQVTFSGP
jgi:hypothetical protein